ncbi:hypothetical protein MJG53_016302 [Ovis ammon polii x Ovis aries]|uniref:Uncharacterized protein n=1 Tax=Ovis ammon polii x Ovis aries TaxID=2918886 RepID=A0ACB9UBL5_9CETA|nr:hypothetical protein MJT46_015977 [Ovis ammon polii x Ovis aries]KAI4563728.1 hypothetical protein MJG53_016302 [Ovis ammon polii x Ovis aries]
MAERLAAAATGCFGPAYRSAPGLPSADRAGRGLAGNPLPDPRRTCRSRALLYYCTSGFEKYRCPAIERKQVGQRVFPVELSLSIENYRPLT